MKKLIKKIKTSCNISWLKLVNKVLFEWFFIRLTKHQEKRIEDFKLSGFDLMSDGNIGSRGVGETKTYQ